MSDSELVSVGELHIRDGLDPITIWRDTSDALSTGCVGGGVWSASPVFIRFLSAMRQSWAGAKVLELGAGGGAVGMALARMGTDVTVSDTPAMLPVLECNVRRNFVVKGRAGSVPEGAIDCMVQLWGEPLKGGPYDLVLGSDIVYMDGSFEPLVSTMLEAARQGAEVLFAYAPQRGEAPSFEMQEPSDRFMQVAQRYFDVEALEQDIIPHTSDRTIAPFGHDCPISIYSFKLKESAEVK